MASRRSLRPVAFYPWLQPGLPLSVMTLVYGGVTELRQFGHVLNVT
jgi:hypothetical protein